MPVPVIVETCKEDDFSLWGKLQRRVHILRHFVLYSPLNRASRNLAGRHRSELARTMRASD